MVFSKKWLRNHPQFLLHVYILGDQCTCYLSHSPLSLHCSDIIRNAVNASSRDDCVLFAGSGCTGAVHKLIHALNCPSPPVSQL